MLRHTQPGKAAKTMDKIDESTTKAIQREKELSYNKGWAQGHKEGYNEARNNDEELHETQQALIEHHEKLAQIKKELTQKASKESEGPRVAKNAYKRALNEAIEIAKN